MINYAIYIFVLGGEVIGMVITQDKGDDIFTEDHVKTRDSKLHITDSEEEKVITSEPENETREPENETDLELHERPVAGWLVTVYVLYGLCCYFVDKDVPSAKKHQSDTTAMQVNQVIQQITGCYNIYNMNTYMLAMIEYMLEYMLATTLLNQFLLPGRKLKANAQGRWVLEAKVHSYKL